MACWRKAFLPVLCALSIIGSVQANQYKLSESLGELELLHSDHWKVGEVEGRKSLILDKTGEQRPPVRRPGEYALLKSDHAIGEFTVVAATLEPDARNNRDVCLIFGYQDDTHFYYAHVSSNSDNKYHNIIMRVDGDSRTRINQEKDPEARLAQGWTTIRIQHGADGEINVFVSDLKTPLMTAKDTTYPVGKIGFGAFDDRAAFSTLTVE